MKISKFNNPKDTTPFEYDLEKWLLETINPPKLLLNAVNRYRNSMNKEIKSKLPCITVSANFKDHRSEKNIKEKNPLIVLDIDRYAKKGKHNLCVDMLLVKEMFMNHPCTLYCGYSVSGDGIYAIIKLYTSDSLEKYFDYFQEKLANIGINIDGSCKDYARLRFFSHDSEAYYNPKAKRYKLPVEKVYVPFEPIASIGDEEKVQAIIEVIERNGIDITSSYGDWTKIAGVLNNNFGVNGRDYFHRLSKMNFEYDHSNCDRKYRQCSKMNKVTSLGVLFNICKDYGVRY